MPPSKWLIAKHPLPLPELARICDCVVGVHLVLWVIRVKALNGQRIFVAVALARLRNVLLANPVREAFEGLGEANATARRELECTGLYALDAITELSQGRSSVEVVGLLLPRTVFKDAGRCQKLFLTFVCNRGV